MPIDATLDITHIQKPIMKHVPKFSVTLKVGGNTHPLTTLPNLDMLKLAPSAKANSLPLNHFDTIAD